ncbi:hypothetical protein CEUSTIGMA_g7703.t1 [Chlamydomonas eustigma]|uniref:Uncharacterized protein n=1 Tax=Chlamydomonas eustigma TaxID=1157962 RepID=A0A250XAY0_9CHLO|nr:hypothetical protein CEUSTIGMA_g7703.t1 [Chlamydomonas eustigma]|eukprot:GAX80265.1 hypothetical protein CEUSTIGMA_g7703.t1 [Chlamydomonas eustigma]
MSSLDFKLCHESGPASLEYVTLTTGTISLLSAGSDGKITLRDADSLGETHSYSAGEPVNCIASHSKSNCLAIGVDNKAVLLNLSTLEFKKQVSSEALPVRALAISPDGSRLAVGGDFSDIRLVPLSTGAAAGSLKSDPYVRSLAWDPEQGSFLAASEAHGYMAIYELSSKAKTRRRCMPKVDILSTARCCVGWHQEGTFLAAPGNDKDVTLFERFSWQVVLSLAEGHTAPVSVLQFSPNGLYVVTGSNNGEIRVWDISTSSNPKVIASTVVPATSQGLPASPISVTWHPKKNAMAISDAAGRLCIWQAPVPADLTGPAMLAEVEEGARHALSGGKPFGSFISGCGAEGGDEVAAGGNSGDHDGSLSGEGAGDSQGEGVSREEKEGLAEEDEVLEAPWDMKQKQQQKQGGHGSSSDRSMRATGSRPPKAGVSGTGGHMAAGVSKEVIKIVERAPQGPKPQPPFQPGSTPVDPLASGANRGCRYLAYNMLGFVSSGPGIDEDCGSVEINFHDTSKMPGRPPVLSDPWGLSMAALGLSGALHASSSTLVYRPFDSSQGNGMWTAQMNEGETITAVAAGADFCAASTSRQLLRIFSPTGVQLAVISSAGGLVALAAQEEGSLLAVLSHASQPDIHTKSQRMRVEVYDLSTLTLVERCEVAMTPGCTLTWLGFSSEGLLATMDSSGVLRMRSSVMGGSWVPVFESSAHCVAGEVFWPVGLSISNLTCIVCSKSQPNPHLHPRPIFTKQALQVPLLSIEGGSAGVESDLLISSMKKTCLSLSNVQGGSACGTEMLEMEIANANVEVSKCLMKLYYAALEGDKQARGLELACRMEDEKSLEGAIRLANFKRMPRLAEAIGNLLSSRQEAAAAAAHLMREQQNSFRDLQQDGDGRVECEENTDPEGKLPIYRGVPSLERQGSVGMDQVPPEAGLMTGIKINDITNSRLASSGGLHNSKVSSSSSMLGNYAKPGFDGNLKRKMSSHSNDNPFARKKQLHPSIK